VWPFIRKHVFGHNDFTAILDTFFVEDIVDE